jgi:DNA replicative helicase MCM subunit Mcm2 (Cdc46/Mcm family)
MKKPDYLFECRKCGHNLYIDKNEMYKMLKVEECPECGEETPIFIFVGEGDFTKSKS